MITPQAFLAGIQEISDSRPTYRLGGSGTDGTCDCIGLIIGAIRRAGGTWTGNHGSNWAARHAMQGLSDKPRLELGALMYKAHAPGTRGWSLPASYQGHPDQRDYYHVGVVTSVTPLRITHCTSWGGGSGIKVDTSLGAWKYGGRAKGIDYARKEEPAQMEKAIVKAKSGKTVRLRVSPSIQAVASANVPIGSEVTVLQRAGDWWEVNYLGKRGWMMSMFLDGSETVPPGAPGPPSIDREAMLLELRGVMQRGLALVSAMIEEVS